MLGQIVTCLLILIGPKLTRTVLGLCVLPGLVFAAEPTAYRVLLQNEDASLRYEVATLTIEPDGKRYQLSMNDQAFGDYFLSMRPFKCMDDGSDMLCHLPYPYPLKREISATNLVALEHEFLFIRRRPTDYGIDPWNGLYYRLQRSGDGFVGRAYEVDLNILAAPPQGDVLPLVEAEMSEGDVARLWLPRLVIQR
jgi:hypothetical protein